MRIVFMGSDELAIPSLSAVLADANSEIVGVLSQPDRPAGRKKYPRPCLLKQFAREQGLHVMTPEKVGSPASVEALSALTPDLIVVAAYGQYIPSRVIELAPLGAINVHPSLLPKYRGSAPIQWAIANGDTMTGVSIIYLSKRMDAGDLIRQETCRIDPDDTSASLHRKLAALGSELLLKSIHDIRTGTVTRTVQDESKAVEVRKLEKADGEIDWTLPAETLHNRIRAFNPWPGSTCKLPDGTVLKVWKTRIEEASGQPGEVLDNKLTVAAGEKALRLTEIQPAGKKRMPADAFLNGHSVLPGLTMG